MNHITIENFRIVYTMVVMFFTLTMIGQVKVDAYQNVGIGTDTPSEKLDINGNLDVESIIHDNGMSGISRSVVIKNPKGGNYKSIISTETGFIKIKLPASNKSTMLTLKGSVYSYSTGRTFDFTVSGYDYQEGWFSGSSYIESNKESNTHPIRVYNDVDGKYIAIGNENSNWNYVDVTIDKVICHFANSTADIWNAGWEVSIDNVFGGMLKYENLNTSVYAKSIWTNSGSNIFNNNVGNVGIGTDNPSARLHVSGNTRVDGRLHLLDEDGNVFAGNGVGGTSSTGADNIGMGSNVFTTLSSGVRNVALGTSAFRTMTDGTNNFAMGYAAGIYANGDHGIYVGNSAGFSDTGTGNIFFGRNAGQSHTTGNFNLALGYQSARHNTSGIGNIFLGYRSGHYNDGDANVFVGYTAGFNATGSNKLYIENTISDSPLIYGEFDNDILRVNGELEVTERLKITDVINLTPSNTEPSDTSSDPLTIGDIYLDDGTNTTDGQARLRYWDGSDWIDL